MDKGKITQVLGPVVDVLFEGDRLPIIKEALTVQLNDQTLYRKQSGTLHRT